MSLTLLIDFDSTVVDVETLDELARIALQNVRDRETRLHDIRLLTEAGMAGKIGFGESLSKRLALLSLRQEHISELIEFARTRITPSFKKQIATLLSQTDQLYVISGGFREVIMPVIKEFGISPDHVLANNFVVSAEGKIMGVDVTNNLAHDNGKVLTVRALALKGPVMIVGDGYTDWQVARAGLADSFVVFTEILSRPEVVSRTDLVARDFGDVVKFVGMATAALR